MGSWLAVTARHECLRNLAARKKVVLANDDDTLQEVPAHRPEMDEGLLAPSSPRPFAMLCPAFPRAGSNWLNC